MNMLRTVLSVLLAFLFLQGTAQRTSLVSDPGIVISYFGDALTNPGIKLGLDYPILIKETRKAIPNKRGGFNLTQNSQLFSGLGVGYYTFPGDHSSIFSHLEAGFRLIRHQSNFPRIAFRFDATLGLGYFRYFGPPEVVDGSFRNERRGEGQLMPSFAFTVGQDIKTSSYVAPFTWFIKPGVFWYKAFGEGSQFLPFVEVGVIYRGFNLPDLPQKLYIGRNNKL